PVRDGNGCGVELTGYNFYWPDGRQVGLAFQSFCKIGLRYLFGRQPLMRAKVRLRFYVLQSREASLLKIPSHRIRVLCLRRDGRQLHLHLSDDTPTNIGIDLDHDDPGVLEWVGASGVPDGGRQWFGFLALPATVG